MADITETQDAPDYAAMEAGNFNVIADSIFLLMGLINQEVLRRETAVRQKADVGRNDRMMCMALYGR